ncbi:unnamed protein product [Symbiodinium sp. KB8]|nr:unnamed protein product [Symbiodinium sp. KB8]
MLRIESEVYVQPHRRALQTSTRDDILQQIEDQAQEIAYERAQMDIMRDPVVLVEPDQSWFERISAEGPVSLVSLPYFPFFSNCEGYGSFMSTSKVMEGNPDCFYIDYSSTVNVDQYPWNGQFTPLSDYCEDVNHIPVPDEDGVITEEAAEKPGTPLYCYFEEDIYQPNPLPRWFEVEAETELWQMNKFPISYFDWVGEDIGEWGRTAAMSGLLGTEEIVPAVVAAGSEVGQIPRTVHLSILYYQFTKGEKRLVQVGLDFDDLCTISESEQELAVLAAKDPPILPCEANNYNYTLRFKLEPLDWIDLLNYFEFAPEISHSSFRSQNPVDRPSQVNFEGISGDWMDTAQLDEDRIDVYKQARVGTALICMGLFLVVLGANLFVPNSDKYDDDNAALEEELIVSEEDAGLGNELKAAAAQQEEMAAAAPSEFWAPLLWKRAHLMLSAAILTVFLVVVMEFSYSHTFADNQYTFIVLFKVAQMLLDIVLAKYLRENLLIAPLLVDIAMVEILITMGADTFTDFVTAFFIESMVMVVERIYLDPYLKMFAARIPKWKMQLRRRFMKNRRMTREQRLKEELEYQKILDDIRSEEEGVEPLLDSYFVYSNETLALFMTPLVQLMLLMTDASPFHDFSITQIASLYGIAPTDLIYYTSFALVIIPAQLAMDIFLLNTQEIAHGWKLFDYITYQKYRFSVREVRWQISSDVLDESIGEPLQTVDMMCFSSQFYFITSLFAWGMMIIQFGITSHLRKEFNMFGDVMFGPIFVIVWLLGMLIKNCLIILANVIGIWKRRALEGTIDDEIAAKLALGEGNKEDMEEERLELQALNSERFRHRFLDRNRPWILQHLAELLTPRTLQLPGPDGRPNLEYIRDVYNDLQNMGVGMRAKGDRSDISSDTEAEDMDELIRKNWSKKPLSKMSAAIARFWLEQARKRSLMYKLVSGIMESKKKDRCMQCGRTEASGAIMKAELATNGVPDPHAIDKLIQEFTRETQDRLFDPVSWKAFFRRHAEFYTR